MSLSYYVWCQPLLEPPVKYRVCTTASLIDKGREFKMEEKSTKKKPVPRGPYGKKITSKEHILTIPEKIRKEHDLELDANVSNKTVKSSSCTSMCNDAEGEVTYIWEIQTCLQKSNIILIKSIKKKNSTNYISATRFLFPL